MCPDGSRCKQMVQVAEEEWCDCGGFLCEVCDGVYCCADSAPHGTDALPHLCRYCYGRPTVPEIIKGLTLWQPWAWAIAWKGKRVENRPWHPWRGVTHLQAHVSAAIVAVARLAGCWHSQHSPPAEQQVWWSGPHGWALDDVRPLVEPVPCRGAMGLWTPPTDVLRRVLEQVGPLELPRG